jgi:outer membrane protein TolC
MNEARPLRLEDLLALAEKQRPELIAARRRVEAVASSITAAKSAFKPRLSLMAMADSMKARDAERFTGATFGIVIGLPLLDGGMRKATVSEATAQQRKSLADYEKVALQVIRDVEIAWLALQAAERNVKTAEIAIAAAEEDYRVVQLRYESGRGVNVEVLDTLTALTRARTNHAQALFDDSVAKDQLLRAMGQG